MTSAATDLPEALSAARSSLRETGGPFAQHADVTFSAVKELAAWLVDSTAKAKAGEFVIPALEDGVVDTLYLWLSTSRSTLSCGSSAPPRSRGAGQTPKTSRSATSSTP